MKVGGVSAIPKNKFFWELLSTCTTFASSSAYVKQNFYLRDIANCAKMEGRMEGEQIGVVREKKIFALKLLKRGTPFEEVIDLTELSKEQVLELLHQIPKS